MRSPLSVLPDRAPTVVAAAAAVAVYPQWYFWNSIPGIHGYSFSCVEIGERLFCFHHYLTDNFFLFTFLLQ